MRRFEGCMDASSKEPKPLSFHGPRDSKLMITLYLLVRPHNQVASPLATVAESPSAHIDAVYPKPIRFVVWKACILQGLDVLRNPWSPQPSRSR